MSVRKSRGYSVCNDLLDEAAQSIRVDPHGVTLIPWKVGALGVESKVLVSLAQRYGAMGLTSTGEGSKRKFKFYYSRSSAGNWFTEVWPLWKVSAWFSGLIFFGVGFQELKVGMGCFVVGVLLLLAFGPRAIAALRNSVVAGKLSGYAYARESYPLLMAGAILGVIMLEWAYVLPWQAGKAAELMGGVADVLTLSYGLSDFISKAVKCVAAVAVFAVVSVLAYQVAGIGMMRFWLQTASNDGFLFDHPEQGTWFYKLMVVGSNPLAGFFSFGFFVMAASGLAVPFLQ